MFKISKKLLVAVMVIALCPATGCKSNTEDKVSPEKTIKSSGEKLENPTASGNKESTVSKGQETPEIVEEEAVKGKYSDNEVYTGDDGKEYSQTEDGTEVEITGDNFQALLEEYEKVKGTGSEREKELLDQIQVIMDIVSNKSPQ